MRKGLIRIAPHVIKEALKFPLDWEIESMNTVVKNGHPIIEAIILGNDFPEEPEVEGVKECELIIHAKQLIYEVKERC